MSSDNRTDGSKEIPGARQPHREAETPADMIQSLTDGFAGKNRDAGIGIALFLSALFVIIAISSPGLFLNDEWITVNQLHQITIGHQVMINEGKYGVYENGTPGNYFAHFGNILRYPVSLPLASMPAMKWIDLYGQNFRMAVLLLWATLPFCSALMISLCYPEYAIVKSVRITVLGAVAGFLLFIINLPGYTPFVYAAPDAPVEVAAVVLTSHLFFALTVAVTYLIARRIFDGRWDALLATLVCTSCSSYLFWAGTAKDHMATAAVFALVLYFFVCYVQARMFRDAACGFFLVGILAWIRPELGFSALFCMGLWFIADNLWRFRQKTVTARAGIIACTAVLFTAAGSVPLLINNLLTTGNPLVPPLLLEHSVRHGATAVIVAPIAPVASAGRHVVTMDPFTVIGNFGANLGNYVFSITPNPLADLSGILFFPATGGMGFFFVVPFALLAIVLSAFLVTRKKTGERTVLVNREHVLLLLVTAFTVLLPYLHNLHGLNTDFGIMPDIRYLSPAYLPVTLLSLMVLKKTVLLERPEILVKKICLSGLLSIPLLYLVMMMTNLRWIRDPTHIFLLFTTLICLEVFAVAMLAIFYHSTGRPADSVSDLGIILLVLTLLVWQLMTVFLGYPSKFNGYTFWVPGVDTLYHFVSW
jgi:hypothetical protein